VSLFCKSAGSTLSDRSGDGKVYGLRRSNEDKNDEENQDGAGKGERPSPVESDITVLAFKSKSEVWKVSIGLRDWEIYARHSRQLSVPSILRFAYHCSFS
jgi:hypothetical protein